MTIDPSLEKLREAVQAYVNEDEEAPLVVTDFAVVYAAIDMHTAGTEAVNGYATGGALHSSLGLAHILVNGLSESDDD